MKRLSKVLLIVNIVFLIIIFLLYASNKNKQEEIVSNMISIQTLKRQLDQIKVVDSIEVEKL